MAAIPIPGEADADDAPRARVRWRWSRGCSIARRSGSRCGWSARILAAAGGQGTSTSTRCAPARSARGSGADGRGGAFLTLSAFNAVLLQHGQRAGWICVALVVFASWRPGKALLGALLFAFFDALQLRLQQGRRRGIPTRCTSCCRTCCRFSRCWCSSRAATYPGADEARYRRASVERRGRRDPAGVRRRRAAEQVRGGARDLRPARARSPAIFRRCGWAGGRRRAGSARRRDRAPGTRGGKWGPADASTRAARHRPSRTRRPSLETGRHADAVGDYDRALACGGNHRHALQPAPPRCPRRTARTRPCGLRARAGTALRSPGAPESRAVALSAARASRRTVASLDRAIAGPSYADAWINRGNALRALDPRRRGARLTRDAMQIDPGAPFLRGTWLHARIRPVRLERHRGRMRRLEAHGPAGGGEPPFPVLGLSSSPEVLHAAATTWVAARCPERRDVPPIAPARRTRSCASAISRRRSTSTRPPTSWRSSSSATTATRSDRRVLVRARYGRCDARGCSARVRPLRGHRAPVRRRGGDALARARHRHRGRPHGLHATAARASSRAARRRSRSRTSGIRAPWALHCIDYAIADRSWCPTTSARVTPRVVRMPACFQVNDVHRPCVPRRLRDRSSAGLPDDASDLAVSCFTNWKTTPLTFDAWTHPVGADGSAVAHAGQPVGFSYGATWRRRRVRTGPGALLGARAARPARGASSCHHQADLFLDIAAPLRCAPTASDACLDLGLPVLTTVLCDAVPRPKVATSCSPARPDAMPELVAP